MATTPINNIVKEVAPRSIFDSAASVIDSTVSINQGDLVALVGGKLKAIAIDGDTATFLGVMPVTVVSGKIPSPYSGTAVDAVSGVTEIPGPKFGVVASLKLKSGEAFNPGDLVYPAGSVDAQTVSSSSNTGARTACGVFQGPAVASATSGQTGLVLLGAVFPGSAPQF